MTSDNRGGVELLLSKGARIRNWIRMQEKNVEVAFKKVNGVRVRALRIRHAEACFLPGGIVGLKMQGFENLYIAFRSRTVMEIRNLKGVLVTRNYFMCPNCYTLTGKQGAESSKAPDGYPVWYRTHQFSCQTCGEHWEHVR